MFVSKSEDVIDHKNINIRAGLDQSKFAGRGRPLLARPAALAVEQDSDGSREDKLSHQQSVSAA